MIIAGLAPPFEPAQEIRQILCASFPAPRQEGAWEMRPESTLVVVANHEAARFFHGADAIASLEYPPFRSIAATEVARSGCEAGEPDFLEDAYDLECRRRAFLLRVANEVNRAATEKEAGHLILCAPPGALCMVRDHLSRETRRLIACELAADLTSAGADLIEAQILKTCGSTRS